MGEFCSTCELGECDPDTRPDLELVVELIEGRMDDPQSDLPEWDRISDTPPALEIFDDYLADASLAQKVYNCLERRNKEGCND